LEPTRDSALVDLLDRILAKGVILHADLIISVSGVPLIGVNLKAAIAGMTTMLDYGMMEAWDEKIRECALENNEEEPPLEKNEKIAFKTYASYCYRDSSLPRTRPGYLYLTNKRLFLFRRKPAETIFQTRLDKIQGLTVERKKYLRQEEECLLLLIENGRSNGDAACLRMKEVRELKRMIEKGIERIRASSPLTVNGGKQMPPHQEAPLHHFQNVINE